MSFGWNFDHLAIRVEWENSNFALYINDAPLAASKTDDVGAALAYVERYTHIEQGLVEKSLLRLELARREYLQEVWGQASFVFAAVPDNKPRVVPKPPPTNPMPECLRGCQFPNLEEFDPFADEEEGETNV